MFSARKENQPLNPKVFVLVPSYNHARFVERCLKSIINQTLQPEKLLVIDDGSRDDSPRVIAEVLRDCSFPAELILRENRGLCRTLNEGFAESSGDYFAYLGSDDVWLPDFLRHRVEMLENERAAVLAYGNAFLIDEIDAVIDDTTEWGTYKPDNAREMLFGGFAPISSTVCYRRVALETVSWNDDARLEDYEIYLKLAATGEFAFTPKVDAAWRWHTANTSGDLSFMLDEILAAQHRNAALFGLNEAEIERIERRAKLTYAETLARAGEKSAALKLIGESFREKLSAGFIAKIIMLLLAPKVVRERRKRLRRERFTRKYGSLR